MKTLFIGIVAILTCLPSCSQNSSKTRVENKPDVADLKVGGTCEGCEAVFESPIAFAKLPAADTLPGFNDAGPKIEISGTMYKADGKTPAAGVVLYIYHTDQAGNYSGAASESGWGKRHGIRRGWIKTDADGQYKFYTLIPASYPNSTIVKHIHPIIKEPGKTAYWIDDFVFINDPFLTDRDKNRKNPAGGNGVLTPKEEDGILKAKRDIILGLNVQGYPAEK
jgi:protocatechuate 3,4-dioxygenase beta subunit